MGGAPGCVVPWRLAWAGVTRRGVCGGGGGRGHTCQSPPLFPSNCPAIHKRRHQSPPLLSSRWENGSERRSEDSSGLWCDNFEGLFQLDSIAEEHSQRAEDRVMWYVLIVLHSVRQYITLTAGMWSDRDLPGAMGVSKHHSA